MKTKITFCVLALLTLVNTTFAQPAKNKEEIKSLKVGFITKELNLSSDEAQKFWPAYNEFQDKMEKLHKERRDMHKGVKTKEALDSLSNSEVEKMVDKQMMLQEKELQIKKEFHSKVKTLLPIKKVARLYRAEHEFRREILRKMKEGKGGNPNHTPRKGDGEGDDDE